MVLTENCESMLRFLSPQADERSAWFWFYYLCINQHDMAERNSQLPKMGSIYGLFTRVIVYLGDNIVQRLGRGERRSRHWMHEIDETLKLTGKTIPLTLGGILDREYFKRTWIIQEVLLAETVIIPIGKCDFRAGLVALKVMLDNGIGKRQGLRGCNRWARHPCMAATFTKLFARHGSRK